VTRALVTGGSGYIGRRLISVLVARGTEVRATARSQSSADDLRALGADVVPWSLEDARVPAHLFRAVGTLYHLAAPRRSFDPVRGSARRPGDPALREGTRRIAEALAKSDAARMIMTSSYTVYGKVWGEADESAPMQGTTPYALARLGAEADCRTALADTPSRLVVARLTETFGPGSPGQMGVLTKIVAGRFRLIGNGRIPHHMSTADDTVAGLLRCGDQPAAGGRTLNIGSPPRSLRDFVAAASAGIDCPLRDTPWAGLPATLLLQLLRSKLRKRALVPRIHEMLDYQLRPRAFPITLSVRLLGDYAVSDFDGIAALSAQFVAARR